MEAQDIPTIGRYLAPNHLELLVKGSNIAPDVIEERGYFTATGFCWAHDPKNAEQRRKAASRAGRSKASKAIKDLYELLKDLTDQVISGELETPRGAVANQLISTRIRLLEHERRIKELEELEERLEILEQAQEREGGKRRWG
jgi:hypothetical protein